MTRSSTRLGTALLLLAALAACSGSGGPGFLADFEPPPHGESLPSSFWEDVPQTGRAHEYTLWPIPMWLSGQATLAADDGKTLYHFDGSSLNLGLFVIPVLPLWTTVELERFSSDGQRGHTSVGYTPFWTWSSSENWPADAEHFDAWGIPLLYSNVRWRTDQGVDSFNGHYTLWTLGPAGLSFNTSLGGTQEKGWFVWPIYGAGIGTLLWQSARIDGEHGGWFEGHGPLLGLLGYVDKREIHGPWYRVDGQRIQDTTTTLLLGGALWWSRESRDDEGSPYSAWNGPLWGMFGWGYSEGDPCVRLLWIPITY